MKIYNEKCTYDQKMMGWQAWHTAGLYRCKKMPKLSEIMGRGETKKDIAAKVRAVLMATFPSKKG